MKKKDDTPVIIPYAYHLDGNLMGNPVAHLSGLPVFVSETTEEEAEENLR